MRIVLIVGNNVWCSFQSSGLPNKETALNIDLNKPWIISSGGELSDLEHLPTKTEYIKYLQIADTCTSRLFGPFM